MSVRGKQNNDTCFCPESSCLLQSSYKVRPLQMRTSASTNNRGCLLHEGKHQRSQRIFFFFFYQATNAEGRPRALHFSLLPSVCLIPVRRQPSEEAFGTALPESGRGAEAPGGQRTSGGAQSGKRNTQGHSPWDTVR